MTTTTHTTGRVLPSVQFDPTNVTPNAFVELGYSEDGFSISERPLTVDVHSDRNGGLQGAPVDIQYMSSVATIRGRLTEFEMATIQRLRQVATKSLLTDGQIPTPGCLLIKEGEYHRLMINGDKDVSAAGGGAAQNTLLTPLNFNIVILREVIDVTVGSKVSAIDLTFSAYPFEDADDSDKLKLWNRDTVA